MSSDNTLEPAPSLDLPDFTEKQEAFISAFIELRRPGKSAIRAGYSPKNASVEANRLLKDPRIHGEIQKRISESGWTKPRCVAEVNNTYTELLEADRHNWKERREFITLMSRLMGYWDTSGSNGNTFILQNCQVRLESYNQSYRTHAQIIDTKEVKGFVALEVAPNNQQVIGRNDAESNKISARGMDSPPTGSM